MFGCHGNQHFGPICPKALCSHPGCYVCTGYQQLQWWYDQKWIAWRHHFPHNKCMGKIYKCSRTANSVVSGPIWLKFKLVRDFIHVLVTCKYKKDQIKNNQEKVDIVFPIISQWRLSVYMESKVFIWSAQNLMQLSPTQKMILRNLLSGTLF